MIDCVHKAFNLFYCTELNLCLMHKNHPLFVFQIQRKLCYCSDYLLFSDFYSCYILSFLYLKKPEK